ncbi:MAG: hypothetical protein ACOX8R_09695 [Bacillota bacterium]|jgi:Pyruvate/2-oxoacid:ferredoxin oxidoreductase delta subunit
MRVYKRERAQSGAESAKRKGDCGCGRGSAAGRKRRSSNSADKTGGNEWAKAFDVGGGTKTEHPSPLRDSCRCSPEHAAKVKKAGKNGKAFIDTRFCGANADHCWPLHNCPNGAIEVVPDAKSGFGHRFVVNEEKCSGCGVCIDHCCGDCIEMK